VEVERVVVKNTNATQTYNNQTYTMDAVDGFDTNIARIKNDYVH